MSRRRDRADWWKEAATLARWGALAAAVCLIAMAFVHLRNQQVLTGQRIRDHEERVASLRRRIEAHEIAILRLQERSALRERIGAGLVDVVPFGPGVITVPEGELARIETR